MNQILNILALMIISTAVPLLIWILFKPYAAKAAGITMLILLGVTALIWAIDRVI